MADPTMTAAPAAPMGAETAAPPMSDMGALEPSGGYCIEIRVDGSGQMKVGVEPAKPEEPEEGEEGEEESYQPVGSLQEAFKLVKQIISSQGTMEDQGTAQDQMNAGFSAGAGRQEM